MKKLELNEEVSRMKNIMRLNEYGIAHPARFTTFQKVEHEPKYKIGDIVRVKFYKDGWDRRPIPHVGKILGVEVVTGINMNEVYVYDVEIMGKDDTAPDTFKVGGSAHNDGEVVKVSEDNIHTLLPQ